MFLSKKSHFPSTIVVLHSINESLLFVLDLRHLCSLNLLIRDNLSCMFGTKSQAVLRHIGTWLSWHNNDSSDLSILSKTMYIYFEVLTKASFLGTGTYLFENETFCASSRAHQITTNLAKLAIL